MWLLVAMLCSASGAQPPQAEILPGAHRGEGHCAKEELVLYDCPVSGGKHLSLCAKDDLSFVQYRFGPLGTPELLFSPDGDPTQITFGHTAWARGEEYRASFVRDGHEYRIVDATGSGIDGASNNYQGVQVHKDGKQLAFVKCEAWPEASMLAALYTRANPPADSPR